MTEHIMSWSHSSLSNFEKCKFLAKLKHLDKIPEPARTLKPGQTEFANDRGTRIHDHCEAFVTGLVPNQIPEMKKFEVEFDQLRHLHGLGMVSCEGEWAVDRDWTPTDWKTGWHRSKVDSIVFPNPEVAVVIDYKSGKRFGNEVKHAEQTQLYALNAVLRYPKLEVVHTELWYLDVDEMASATFTRAQVLRFKANFDRRGRAMTSATSCPPNANIFSCQWCRYGTANNGSGDCKVGVFRGK